NQATGTRNSSQVHSVSNPEQKSDASSSIEQLAEKILEWELSSDSSPILPETIPSAHKNINHLTISTPSATTTDVEEKPFAKFELSPVSPITLTSPTSSVGEDFPILSSRSSDTVVEDAYPEGGLQAWLVVFGAWCGMFASLGVGSTLATFQAHLSVNQMASYSPEQIGWIFSIYAFLTFGCGIYTGSLFDIYGPRWLVLSGSVCQVACMFLLPHCSSFYHFAVVFGILGGVGSALIFTSSIASVGHFFNKRRGHATGITAGGGAFGGIVFPLLLQSLIPRIGFAWAVRIMGFIILLLCIIASLLLRSRLPPAPRSPHPDFRILANPAFATTVIGVFLVEWALFIPLTYITSYALKEGFPYELSYAILPILNAGSVFGRWIPGLYSDLLGRYNTFILFLLISIISILTIWFSFGPTTPGLIIFALIFGFSSGSNISLTPVCIGQLCGTQDYGRYYATCYSIVSIGCLTGIPLAGEVLQICHGSYWGLILFTGVCHIGALAAFIIARGLGGSWSVWKKY
ncbi:hypothetical protein HYFRA_00007604, partial [Hymenoscyphus fraxineus]